MGLKCFSCLDDGVHLLVVEGLGQDDGVVGRLLVEGRLGEVEEDGVGVKAAHAGDDARILPLDLVQRYFLGGSHCGGWLCCSRWRNVLKSKTVVLVLAGFWLCDNAAELGAAP